MAKTPAAPAPAAKTPAAKAPVQPKEAKAAAPESAAPTPAAAAPEAAGAAADAAAPKKAAGASRPISYFSSVSTPEYRQGWAEIFGKKDADAAPKAAVGKRGPALPVTLELDADALDADLRARLEDLFRRQAKKQRLNYDKLAATHRATWRIACEITE